MVHPNQPKTHNPTEDFIPARLDFTLHIDRQRARNAVFQMQAGRRAHALMYTNARLCGQFARYPQGEAGRSVLAEGLKRRPPADAGRGGAPADTQWNTGVSQQQRTCIAQYRRRCVA